jgi:hypothetical protein
VGVRFLFLYSGCNLGPPALEYTSPSGSLGDNASTFATSNTLFMATRRIPLIPPPLPQVGADAVRGVGDEQASSAPETAPHGYRGKSSGEFRRVNATLGGHTDALVAEAERWLGQLTSDDNYHRLLQLAVLRRDPALLTGLLAALRAR